MTAALAGAPEQVHSSHPSVPAEGDPPPPFVFFAQKHIFSTPFFSLIKNYFMVTWKMLLFLRMRCCKACSSESSSCKKKKKLSKTGIK